MADEKRSFFDRLTSPLTGDYRREKPLSVSIAEQAIELTPVGTAYTAVDIQEELDKESPDWVKVGTMAGSEIIGLLPGLGDAAQAMIRKGAARAAKKSDDVVEAGSSVPLVSNPKLSDQDYTSRWSGFDEAATPEEWQAAVDAFVKEERSISPTIRTPELEQSASDLLEGRITREQHLANVSEYKPVGAWDQLPREPSDKATVFSLKPDQRDNGRFILPEGAAEELGVTPSGLKVGDRFNGRLDIPAYNRFDTWIVAGTSTAEKGATHYAKAIHYVGPDGKPVRFAASQKTGERIGTGEIGKTGYATVSGVIKDLDADSIREKAEALLNDPEWTQVGFDPRRQSGFYVRSGENVNVPVREADEVIQIGPLVLARNAKLDFEHTGYAEGGKVEGSDKEEMDVLLNEQVDPVSGNVAPLGAKPEEVRDDIEINVSPNEFVIDAATLRYFGEDFFKGLQDAAEDGWERLKGEAEGTPADDMEDALEEAEDEPTGLGARKGFSDGGNTTEARIEEALNAPRTNTAIPQPSGGGYGGYGGTGAGFGGFESQVYVNTETGQRVVIYMFNGKPMRRIPEGFIPEDQVESVTEEDVAEALGDEAVEDVVTRGPPEFESLQAPESNYNKKPVDTWTMDDYDAYRQDMEEYNSNPLAAKVENGLINLIGGLIGGPVGSTALSAFVKKSKIKQAEAVNTQINNILKSGFSPVTGTELTIADSDRLASTQIQANIMAADISERKGLIGKAIDFLTPASQEPLPQTTGTPLYEQYTFTPDKVEEDPSILLPPGYGGPETFTNEEDTGYKPKYDISTGTFRDKGYQNLLTEEEQRKFDFYVDRGMTAQIEHFELINQHRNVNPTSEYYPGSTTTQSGSSSSSSGSTSNNTSPSTSSSSGSTGNNSVTPVVSSKDTRSVQDVQDEINAALKASGNEWTEELNDLVAEREKLRGY